LDQAGSKTKMNAISDHDTERLSLNFFALTDIVEILIHPTELFNLLNSLIEKKAEIIAPLHTDIIMLWHAFTGDLRAHAMFGYDTKSLRRIGFQTGEH